MVEEGIPESLILESAARPTSTIQPFQDLRIRGFADRRIFGLPMRDSRIRDSRIGD